jgi:DNA-directed RNA polymerase sigma subunit (sigma70/sigma32)
MIHRQPIEDLASPADAMDTWGWLLVLGCETPASARAMSEPGKESELRETCQRCRLGVPERPDPRQLELKAEEETRVMRAIAEERCVRAKERLFFHGLHVLTRIVNAYEGRGLSTGDLIEHGAHGLRDAIERCDPSQGVRFSTIASWWIKQSIKSAMAARREPAVAK